MSTKFNYIYVVLDITDADKEVPIANALIRGTRRLPQPCGAIARKKVRRVLSR